uniref:RRM domain-containing protein n=1 Tax=Pinguiococcus pyrenoidosus TaxID=172671 RepID=A0A7R9YDH0_9STRA
MSDVREGLTIFVRNIPFDCTREQLKEAFEQFAEVATCALVKDPETNLLRGSAFVKMKNKEGVEEILAAAEVDELSDGISLNGRLLRCSLAVPRNEAKALSAESARTNASTGKDKRNLYLLDEGRMLAKGLDDDDKSLESESERIGMHPSDAKKRTLSHRENKQKLKNPLFFVNGRRLSIRNLDYDVDDSELRELADKAAREGLQKVSAKDIRKHLTAQGRPPDAIRSDELQVSYWVEDQKSGKAQSNTVASVKVMRDMDHPKKLSRGFGFVEFTSHVAALAALRMLNNNPNEAYVKYAQGKGRVKKKARGAHPPRLIVEFVVENHRKMQEQQKRREMLLRQRETAPKGPAKDGGATPREKRSRGARQRERRRQQRASSEQQGATDQKSGGGHDRTDRRKAKRPKNAMSRAAAKPAKRTSSRAVEAEERFDETVKREADLMASTERGRKKRKRKGAEEHKKEQNIDSLVRSYKEKLFGKEVETPKDKEQSPKKRRVSEGKRWFD